MYMYMVCVCVVCVHTCQGIYIKSEDFIYMVFRHRFSDSTLLYDCVVVCFYVHQGSWSIGFLGFFLLQIRDP